MGILNWLYLLFLTPVSAIVIFLFTILMDARRNAKSNRFLLCIFGAGIVSAILITAGKWFYLELPEGAFLLSMVLEEFVKYSILKRITWNSENFGYSFDGILFSVIFSFPFIFFPLFFGMNSLGIRSMATDCTMILCLAVFQGNGYAKAKYSSLKHNKLGEMLHAFFAMLVPVFVKGIYCVINIQSTVYEAEITSKEPTYDKAEAIVGGLGLVFWAIISAFFVVCVLFAAFITILIRSRIIKFCISNTPEHGTVIYRPGKSWTCQCGAKERYHVCRKCGHENIEFFTEAEIIR